MNAQDSPNPLPTTPQAITAQTRWLSSNTRAQSDSPTKTVTTPSRINRPGQRPVSPATGSDAAVQNSASAPTT